MKYLDYREDKIQGSFDFPVDFYHVDSSHPRYQMPYHWHPEYEIIRILRGSFHLTLDGKTLTAKEGDMLFIHGGTLHGGTPEDCIYECAVFDMRIMLSNNKICNKVIQQLMRHELLLKVKHYGPKDPVSIAAKELFRTMDSKGYGYEFRIQGSLYHIIGTLLEQQSFLVNTAASTASAQQINRFKDVLNYIEEHYTQSITLEDMAGVAGLSPRYFCRFFRKMTQCTPMEYLNYYRIECACEQLAEIQISITDVALNCGFNDISYFIKSFHKAKGVTPRQYKESTRQISCF